LAPLSATQAKPFGLKATPHGFFRFGSVCDAGRAPSETSDVAVNDDCTGGLGLFELELPPHDTSVASVAAHAVMPNTSTRDFMAVLLVPVLSTGRDGH
jgi:hypothetical protein